MYSSSELYVKEAAELVEEEAAVQKRLASLFREEEAIRVSIKLCQIEISDLERISREDSEESSHDAERMRLLERQREMEWYLSELHKITRKIDGANTKLENVRGLKRKLGGKIAEGVENTKRNLGVFSSYTGSYQEAEAKLTEGLEERLSKLSEAAGILGEEIYAGEKGIRRPVKNSESPKEKSSLGKKQTGVPSGRGSGPSKSGAAARTQREGYERGKPAAGSKKAAVTAGSKKAAVLEKTASLKNTSGKQRSHTGKLGRKPSSKESDQKTTWGKVADFSNNVVVLVTLLDAFHSGLKAYQRVQDIQNSVRLNPAEKIVVYVSELTDELFGEEDALPDPKEQIEEYLQKDPALRISASDDGKGGRNKGLGKGKSGRKGGSKGKRTGAEKGKAGYGKGKMGFGKGKTGGKGRSGMIGKGKGGSGSGSGGMGKGKGGSGNSLGFGEGKGGSGNGSGGFGGGKGGSGSGPGGFGGGKGGSGSGPGGLGGGKGGSGSGSGGLGGGKGGSGSGSGGPGGGKG